MTFKDNYAWVGDAVGQDLVGVPTLAEGPWFALDFTIAWWEGKVPDHVLGDERKVRKVVNGGYIGIEEVERLAKLVRGALQC
jgi:putative chitinase